MTRRRRRLLIGLAVLALGGVLGLPGVHWRLIGWARGEPFYRGRPATYWSAVLREANYAGSVSSTFDPMYVSCPAGPLPQVRERLGLQVGRESVDPDDLPWA